MSKFQSQDRRSFLKLAGAAAITAGVPMVSPAIGLASLNKKLKVAQETKMLMGTVVSVTVLDPSAARAQDALSAAFRSMARLVPLFDRHSGNGPVATLNRDGVLNEIPPQLQSVFNLAFSVHQQSQGAFDITVAPVIDAYKLIYAKGGDFANDPKLDKAAKAMGCLVRRGKGLALTRENAAITLDGVAKGFIVDQGLKAAAKAGASRVLINAGGDLAVLGDRGNGKPWRVAVSKPESPDQAKVTIGLTKGALATSGNYEVYFDREKLYHHIINPATGASPVTDLSASVRAPSAAVADALSTTCFVMEPNRAMAFLRSRPGVEGMVLTRYEQRYQTKGFMG